MCCKSKKISFCWSNNCQTETDKDPLLVQDQFVPATLIPELAPLPRLASYWNYIILPDRLFPNLKEVKLAETRVYHCAPSLPASHSAPPSPATPPGRVCVCVGGVI